MGAEMCISSRNNTYGEAAQVPGVYELKWKEKSYDREVVELVKKLLDESVEKDMINTIKRLLLSNKNLVLTGAPGTGKTYMANNIAADIIFSGNIPENFEDCDEFKERRGFVQFHPSYDYTDFVEGIRPAENQGFERRDGIFKKFCKKALKNLIDSKKDTYALTFENVVYRYLLEFISDIEESIENDGKFPIKGFSGKDVAPICCIEFSDYEKVLSFSVDTDTRSIRIKKYVSKCIELYDMFINIDDFKNIKCEDFQEKLGIAGSRTYHYGFLNAFDDNYGDKIKEALNNTVNKVEEKEYVFIIDEINRGDLNKIFGELFFAVDSGYRGKKGLVNTQYQNLIEDGDEFKNGFFIPDNVYIIGTMNDIDRSVESMDFALRRRFVWKEIKAEDTQYILDIFDSITELHNKGISSQKVKDKMNALNKSIKSIKGFNCSYHIG
ncbi:MAG: AAA family ATPase, partial [Mucispirillum sp.]|nr:AAA family ATPase [Mucispirillum sp.]